MNEFTKSIINNSHKEEKNVETHSGMEQAKGLNHILYGDDVWCYLYGFVLVVEKNISSKIPHLTTLHIYSVNHFQYLEVIKEGNRKQGMDMNERIHKTIKIFHTIKIRFIGKKKIALKTKLTVFNIIYSRTGWLMDVNRWYCHEIWRVE